MTIGKVTITKNEILNISNAGMICNGYDYGLLCVLKDKGAPIIGTTNLRPDVDRYDFTEMRFDHTDDIVVMWSLRENQ